MDNNITIIVVRRLGIQYKDCKHRNAQDIVNAVVMRVALHNLPFYILYIGAPIRYRHFEVLDIWFIGVQHSLQCLMLYRGIENGQLA